MNKLSVPILFKNKEDCCGCAACVLLCPKKAIFMKYDNEGFAYPFIDKKKCIGCKKCLKVCFFKKNYK